LIEHDRIDVGRGAGAGACDHDLVLDRVINGFELRAAPGDAETDLLGHRADRDEVAHAIGSLALADQGLDDRTRRRYADHRAVLGGDRVHIVDHADAAGARHQLRYDRRIARQILGEIARDDAGADVDAGAGGAGNEDLDLLAAVELALRGRRRRCERKASGQKDEAGVGYPHVGLCLSGLSALIAEAPHRSTSARMRATVASGPVTMRRLMSSGSGTRAGTIEICPNTITSKSPAPVTCWAISRSCVATSPLVMASRAPVTQSSWIIRVTRARATAASRLARTIGMARLAVQTSRMRSPSTTACSIMASSARSTGTRMCFRPESTAGPKVEPENTMPSPRLSSQ